MQQNTAARYRNLVSSIKNWPVYFTRKLKKGFDPLLLVTRGSQLRFEVPSKALYLVFKEIFVSDFYAIRQLIKKLPANPVIVDIGANAGYFNILLFSKLDTATVYAYEPVPGNYELFKKNISLNPSLQNKIHLFNKAVTGAPAETVELFMESPSEQQSVIASVYADFDRQNTYSIKVGGISLHQLLEENKLQKVDLLKIDCEGSEYPIIYQTPATDWNRINAIAIEVHDLDGEQRNVHALKGFLEAKGYRVSASHAHTNCHTLAAFRQNR